MDKLGLSLWESGLWKSDVLPLCEDSVLVKRILQMCWFIIEIILLCFTLFKNNFHIQEKRMEIPIWSNLRLCYISPRFHYISLNMSNCFTNFELAELLKSLSDSSCLQYTSSSVDWITQSLKSCLFTSSTQSFPHHLL